LPGSTRHIRPFTQLFRKPTVAALLFRRSKLHREIEEPLFVPLRMALYKPDKLLRRRHFCAFMNFSAQILRTRRSR
jgi:hypothetical protein